MIPPPRPMGGYGPPGQGFGPPGGMDGPSGMGGMGGMGQPMQPMGMQPMGMGGFGGPEGQMGGQMDSMGMGMGGGVGGGMGGDPEEDFANEPPILEELDIRPDEIAKRMKSVLLFQRLDHELLADSDLCGPLLIALARNLCFLCTRLPPTAGKVHFGYIYGLGISGCVGAYLLLNLMSQGEAIDLYRTLSILGYGLLPVVVLAFLSIFISLRQSFGLVVAPLCVVWCTATASRFFETALNMTHQRYLVAYPVFLLYACFVLITVF
uniref:Protein YIPF n=1 Tax=Chromera velia CCMP2878 TaxID=1169474 RepID=A0A0G4GYC3_9ALVE|eukprot:Cvel_5399.t1-p1 / transcript=Cvel_5399.t1 / gene=Cvel_5399 / organism=Chromera_velia_CCMP2878 / gene_product=Protein YIPF5 homolog, putative / transcript_product=Protein YIPF5 homolog, putative / location=Cvel_scaffold251:50994-55064(-) / protein_length=264 / sequence_SO=supercontig / SO=protein_coding / is_pseudo=false